MGRERLYLGVVLICLLALAAVLLQPTHQAPQKVAAAPLELPAEPAPTPEPKPALDEMEAAQDPLPELRAGSYVLADAERGQVLAERDPHTERAPASLTKIFTAMVAVDRAQSLDQVVTVAPQAVSTDTTWSQMGLQAGDRLTVRDLLYGIFLVSANDAAEALAWGLESHDQFIADLNQKALELRLPDAHFVNATGIDSDGHHLSAYDLAVAGVQVTRSYPQLLEIASVSDYEIPYQPGVHHYYEMHTINAALGHYQGLTGLKTGYTDDAGGCLVLTATRGGRRLVAVVMHDDRIFSDDLKLLDYGFSRPAPRFLPPGHEL